MNLPIYQLIHFKSADLEELTLHLNEDMNLRRPVALVLKALSLDQQREVIGLVENWFETHEASWRYPYPIFFVSDFSEAIGHMPVVSAVAALPKFYTQKDVKVTVKESQVLDKNRLLQQEIKNADTHSMAQVIENYGINHKKIWYLVREGDFLARVLERLKAQGARRG
jgi:hypothetical protein